MTGENCGPDAGQLKFNVQSTGVQGVEIAETGSQCIIGRLPWRVHTKIYMHTRRGLVGKRLKDVSEIRPRSSPRE